MQKQSKWFQLVLVGFVALVCVLLLFFLDNIRTRKDEGKQTYFQSRILDEKTVDPSVWGANFPHQYDSYKKTVDTERTRYGGSENFQHLDEDPVWRDLFAGYPFSVDYREERGHAYMLSDQRETERVHKFPQPGACLHCHGSMYTTYREAGLKAGIPDPHNPKEFEAQLMKGFEVINPMPYQEATKLVSHPVSCIDCHDPSDMSLRVTRPGFLEGIANLAKSTDPLPHLPSIDRWRKSNSKVDYNPNKHASRQEMRSFVCGQCHVEYYFKGKEKRLTYPWHNGLLASNMEQYYDAVGHKDFTHKMSKTPVLKAQHPEFEMWSQGVHAQSGVACADCHMPYERVGATKISSHHVRSPLLNISKACQTCHAQGEQELKRRVLTIQDRTQSLMNRSETAVMELVKAIEAEDPTTTVQKTMAMDYHRKAQWRLDMVAAENSMGFHAPQESAKLLGESIDFARMGIMALKGVKSYTPAPVSTAVAH